MGACPSCGRDLPSGEFPFCPWCAAPLTAPGAGARKTVSILFCDVVDSTVLGSAVDAEVLRGVLAGYWGRARMVIEGHGGTVEKFIGDAVVGVFGVPVVHEDDALRAVRAAADLLVAVRDLNTDLRSRLGLELAVRVGVNTGEVLSGAGGESLMSGDAANVTARLEAAAGAGEVLVGESTYRLVRDFVDALDVGPLTVKGKAEPLVAFRLVGVRPVVTGRRRRFSGALVGRGRQLGLAETMYATAVEESACVLLTVLGEPGVGKSRLVQELLAGIGDETYVLQGRCLPYGEGITYWPTIEMLTALAAAEATTTLAQHLSGVAHAEQILAGLDTMLGRAEAASGQEVAWSFRRLVETLAARRPVVLVVDDVQWADPGLVDLLDHLSDMSRGAPILLVCMARPEFQAAYPRWGAGRAHSTTMALRPLTESECHQLTVQLLGAQVGAGLLDRVVAASEGVPLFVEELTAMLVDDGQLVPAVEGGWQLAAGLAEVVVPPSVQALVAARLDGLAPDLREVIDVASVIGKTFYPDALMMLVADVEMSARVEALVRADLIQPTTTDLAGHDAYTFSHQLLCDAAYQGLTKARRASLHAALARWLQQRPVNTVGSEVIAYHLEAAATYLAELGNPDPSLAEEAAQLLLAAADRAMALGDAHAAVRLASRAAPLVAADSRLRAEIALTLSSAAIEAGDHATAVPNAKEAEQIGVLLNDQALHWRARLQQCWAEHWVDPSQPVDGMLSLAEGAIEALTAAGDDRGLCLAYLMRAEVHAIGGRLRASAADARQGLHHARRTDRGVLYRWRLVSRVLQPYGDGDGTPTEMEQALGEISIEFAGDQQIEAALFDRRDMLIAYEGLIEEAYQRTSEHYRMALERGSPVLATFWLAWCVSWCKRWAGDLAGAAESLATAGGLLEGMGETGHRSTILAYRAQLLAQLGRDDEAQTMMRQSRAISMDSDLVNDISFAVTEGLLLAHRGDAEASERHFLEALRIVGSTEFLVNHGEVWLARSAACESLGDLAGALAAAKEALACFERKEQVPPIQIARARVAELAG